MSDWSGWERWADAKIANALAEERKNVAIDRENDKQVLASAVSKLSDLIDEQADRISKQDLELKVLKQILLSRKRGDKHERRAISRRPAISPPS
jgi:hypothetical protein